MAGVLSSHRATFRAFASTVVPEMGALDEAGWAEVEATVEHALAARPAKVRRQIGLLLNVIENLARARGGRGFSRMDEAARARFVSALEHWPVKLVRRGIWGLRTLAFMGYYTRQATMLEVGYRADPRGWMARASSAPASHAVIPAEADGAE